MVNIYTIQRDLIAATGLAQRSFDQLPLNAISDLATRIPMIETAIANIATKNLGNYAQEHYGYILNRELSKQRTNKGIAEHHFENHHFERTADPMTRHHDIEYALAHIPPELNRDTANYYTFLLTDTRNNTARDIATSFVDRLAAIHATHNQVELDALNQLRVDILAAPPCVQALLPGGKANTLIAQLDARRAPLENAFRLQQAYDAQNVAARNQNTLDALSDLYQQTALLNFVNWRNDLRGNIHTSMATCRAEMNAAQQQKPR